MAIDATDDGRLDYMIANNIGSNIGFSLGKIEQNWNKKVQELKEAETAKEIVGVFSNPNYTSSQAMQAYLKIPDSVNVRLTDMQKLAIQQFDQIRRQNEAIAPQVKSQMFDAARGGQAGAVDQYGVPDMAQSIQNAGISSAGQAREDLMKPQEKYGIKPWWMHPDYKDTPEGQAAMQEATRIPGTGAGTRGGVGGGTTATGEVQAKPLTESQRNAIIQKTIPELEAQLKIADTPEKVLQLQQMIDGYYTQAGMNKIVPVYDADVAQDIFNKNFIGDGDKGKGIGKGWGTATAGEARKTFNKTVAQLMANGASWEQANNDTAKMFDALRDKNGFFKNDRLASDMNGKDFIRPMPQKAENTTGSMSNSGNTQDVGGSNEDLEAIRWAKANPNDPRAIQILQVNGIR